MPTFRFPVRSIVLLILLNIFMLLTSNPGFAAMNPAGTEAIGPAAPTLELIPASLDLGAVGHGQKYPQLSFQVLNKGSKPWSLTVRPSCGCMKLIGKPGLEIPAGGSQTVSFQLSLGRGWGLFSKRVDLVDRQRQVVASFPVKAQFHPGIKTSAMEAVLATSPLSPLPESEFSVDFIATAKAPELTQLKSGDPRIQFEILESSPAGVTSLRVSSLSTWPAGRFSSQITGLCNGLPFTLPVRGRAFGALIHEPHSWNLKQIRDATTSPETLVVRRADGQPLVIEEMTVEWLRPVDGFDIVLSQKTRGDGSVEIRATAVSPVPAVNKGFYGKVTLTTNVEQEPTVKIDLLGVLQIPRKGRP